MPRLESDKVDKALRGKMSSRRYDAGDYYYPITDEKGIVVASTSISKGAKHTLGDNRVAAMAAQLCLGKATLLVDLVQCRIDRAEALRIMKANCPPGTPKMERGEATAKAVAKKRRHDGKR